MSFGHNLIDQHCWVRQVAAHANFEIPQPFGASPSAPSGSRPAACLLGASHSRESQSKFGWSTMQNASLLVELDAECVHTPEPILKMEIGISVNSSN